MHAHRPDRPFRLREGVTMDAVDIVLRICTDLRKEAGYPDAAAGINRVIVPLLNAACEYIIRRDDDPAAAIDQLDNAVRKMRLATMRELEFSPESRAAYWAGKYAAGEYFRQRHPEEIPAGMMPQRTPCGRWI